MKENGNSYLGTEEGSLKSAVLAFIVDDDQRGRTLEEICRELTLKRRGSQEYSE